MDFGAYRFCKNCGICGDRCPFGYIQKDDPSWEREEATLAGSYQGQFEGWRTDTGHCPWCPICQGTCPFNSNPESFIHNFVKATSSVTPLFNGFFAAMDDFMDYGRKPQEEWWDLEEPSWGYYTTFK